MSLYKRDKTYWVNFVTPTGERIRKTTGTTDKVLAQEFHDKLKAEYWQMSRLKLKPRRSWQEAAERWLIEVSEKASIKTDIMHLRYLDRFLLEKTLDEINADVLNDICMARKKEGVSNATVNRALEIIRAILRKARDEWEWIDRIPKVRLLKINNQRIRWLKLDEAQRLIKECPKHLKAMVQFSLATGLRKSNVTGLEWSQVDLNRKFAWIHPDQAKARRAIAVPLNADAMHVLMNERGKHDTYVFTYLGQPVHQVNTKAFKNALARANIKSFRWHDLRHTWASWHAQNGTPLHVLKELGGWESMEMVQRYAHLAVEHTAPFAENIANVTISSQSQILQFRSKKIS